MFKRPRRRFSVAEPADGALGMEDPAGDFALEERRIVGLCVVSQRAPGKMSRAHIHWYLQRGRTVLALTLVPSLYKARGRGRPIICPRAGLVPSSSGDEPSEWSLVVEKEKEHSSRFYGLRSAFLIRHMLPLGLRPCLDLRTDCDPACLVCPLSALTDALRS